MNRINLFLTMVVSLITIVSTFGQELKYADLAAMKRNDKTAYTSYFSKDGSTYKIGDRLIILQPSGDNGANFFTIVKGVGYGGSLIDAKHSGIEIEVRKISALKGSAGSGGGTMMTFFAARSMDGTDYMISIDLAVEKGEIKRGEVAATKDLTSVKTGSAAGGTAAVTFLEKVGSVSGTVKYLDVDFLNPFSEGLAIVTKGTSEAVIDANGNFVVPFNKWKFTKFISVFGQVPIGFVNGSCVVKSLEGERYGIIDTKGNLIVPCDNLIAFPFDDFGLAVIAGKDKYYFVDRHNKRIEVKNPFLVKSMIDGATPNINLEAMFMSKEIQNILLRLGTVDCKFTKNGVSIGATSKGYSVFDANGLQKSNTYFGQARHFSDGVAAVSQQNEFGESKWGFIDETGKIIVPVKFTLQPGNFSEGLAFVSPVDKTDFHYAYIDKTGAVKLRIKENYKLLYGGVKPLPTSPTTASTPDDTDGYGFQGSFAFLPYEYSYNRKFLLIDKTGKSQMKLIAAIDPSTVIGKSRSNEDPSYKLSDGQILLYGGGLLDLNKNFIIPVGSFDSLSLFDSVSGLAKAHKDTMDGYINGSGEFVILIGKSSKW